MTQQYIAYITRDEVNAHFGQHVILPKTVSVLQSDSITMPPDVPLLGIVYDLDHMWPDERSRMLRRLAAQPPEIRTAVHSYNIREAEVTELEAMQVRVFHALNEEIFKQFVRTEVRRKAA